MLIARIIIIFILLLTTNTMPEQSLELINYFNYFFQNFEFDVILIKYEKIKKYKFT